MHLSLHEDPTCMSETYRSILMAFVFRVKNLSIISGVTYLHVFYLQTKPPVLIHFKRSYYYCDYTINQMRRSLEKPT